MKRNSDGASLSYSHGGIYAGDGDTSYVQRQLGLEATGGSYLSLTAEYREHEHTNRGDIDPRVVDPARIDPDAGRLVPEHQHAVRRRLSVSQPDLR